MNKYLGACIALSSAVNAQLAAWSQCGGLGYTGDTTCVSGYTCTALNAYYSQCQVGSQATTLSTSTVVATSTTSTAAASTSTAAAGATDVQFLGRVNPATRELSWPGSGLAFTFQGTTASIAIAASWGANSVDISIDGADPIVISNVEGTAITTPAGLASGNHSVYLRKRSEYNLGSMYIGQVTTDGTLGTYVLPTRRIEIIGDSISVGYGLDGVYPCTNNASVEDNPKTYGALAAKALDAEYSVIAWSGKGVTRNYVSDPEDTSALMPEIWTRYGENDADNSYTFPADATPDAVVINLGTNDFSILLYNSSGQAYDGRAPLNATVYTDAMVNFVKTVRTHYPDAQYFLVGSPMLSDSFPSAADAQKTTQTNALKAVVAELGSGVQFVDWPTQGSDWGCDSHPNAATHAAGATILEAAIKTTLGW